MPPDYDARDYAPAITPGAGQRRRRARASGLDCRRATRCSRRARSCPICGSTCTSMTSIRRKRFVFINMRKLREGEIAARGRARRRDHADAARSFPSAAQQLQRLEGTH